MFLGVQLKSFWSKCRGCLCIEDPCGDINVPKVWDSSQWDNFHELWGTGGCEWPATGSCLSPPGFGRASVTHSVLWDIWVRGRKEGVLPWWEDPSVWFCTEISLYVLTYRKYTGKVLFRGILDCDKTLLSPLQLLRICWSSVSSHWEGFPLLGLGCTAPVWAMSSASRIEAQH